MVPHTIWQARLHQQRTEIRHSRELVEAAVRTAYPVLASGLIRRLADLDRRLGDLERSGAGQPAGSPMWQALDGLTRGAHRQHREVLRIAGALDPAPDGGLARAQAWLDALRARADVSRPIVLLRGPRRRIDTRLGLVEVPLLAAGPWELPLLAHAVASVAGEEDDRHGGGLAGVADALAAEVREVAGDGPVAPHVHALYADMVATVLAGPAYACALLVLDLDYAAPSAVERATAVLVTLGAMDRLSPVRPFTPQPYREIAGLLDDLCSRALSGGDRADRWAARSRFAVWCELLLDDAVLPRFAEAAVATDGMWQRARARLRGDAGPGPAADLTETLNVLWRRLLDVPDRAGQLAEAGESLVDGRGAILPAPSGGSLSADHAARLRLDLAAGQYHGLAAQVRSGLTGPAAGRMLRLLSEQLRRASADAGSALSDVGALLEGGRPVLREGLELLGGSRLAGAGWDRPGEPPGRAGTCALTDRLLAEYAQRTGVGWATSCALGSEPLLEATTDVVRVRFPDWSIWSVALVAHEFGHIVARETPAFTAWRAAHAAEAGPQIEEVFADVFAAYTFGPAFACAAIVLHLEPVNAGVARGGHPAHADRAGAILRTLTRMGEEAATTTVNPYESVVTRLTDVWSAAVRITGATPAGFRTNWIDDMVELMATYYGLGGEYRPHRWSWAREAARTLIPRPPALAVLRARAAERGVARLDLTDLVNLLWCARMDAVAPDELVDAIGWNLVREYLEDAHA